MEGVQMNERNLRFINRFSIYHVNKPETVAEHSYYVTYYAWKIAKDFEGAGIKIDFRKLLEKALVHDLEETKTGDIITHAKTPIIKNEINNISKKILPIDVYEIWKDAKDDTIEGQIIEFADSYEVLVYCLEEIKSGNKHMISIFETQIKKIKQEDPIFKKYIKDIQEQYDRTD